MTNIMRSLLRRLPLAIACLLIPVSGHAASFPYITLNQHTNRLSDNGSALTFNGSPIGGANWVADGTTNSTLSGVASASSAIVTNSITAGSVSVPGDNSLTNFVRIGNSAYYDAATIQAPFVLSYTDTHSIDGVNYYYPFGMFVDYKLMPASVTYSSDPAAIFGNINLPDTDTNTWTSLTAVDGWGQYLGTGNVFEFDGVHSILNVNGGTITNTVGLSSEIYTFGGHIGEAFGLRVGVVGHLPNVITNAFGAAVSIPTNGIQNNIGLLLAPSNGNNGYVGAPTNTTAAIYQVGTNSPNILQGRVETFDSYTSGAPSGGTAARWKLGSWKTNAVTVISTNYIEVEIGGVLRKLAVVQ